MIRLADRRRFRGSGWAEADRTPPRRSAWRVDAIRGDADLQRDAGLGEVDRADAGQGGAEGFEGREHPRGVGGRRANPDVEVLREARFGVERHRVRAHHQVLSARVVQRGKADL